MRKTLLTGRFIRALGLGSIAGIAMVVGSASTKAADQIQPPPYQMGGANGISVAVVWDEAAIRKALPPGVEPAKGMTGGINIYSVERGYVLGAYSAAYFYVDVEGFDSPEGIKGRWMLAGVYGPQIKTSAALKAYGGAPVRPGKSRVESGADGMRAIGTVGGQDFVTAEIKAQPGSCSAGAVSLHYLALSPETDQVVLTKIPFVGDFCKADLVSVKITPPPGDALAAYTIAKAVGASEFRNGSFTIEAPQPTGK